MTKHLSWQIYVCSNKSMFVVTNLLSQQKLYLWQLPPMIPPSPLPPFPPPPHPLCITLQCMSHLKFISIFLSLHLCPMYHIHSCPNDSPRVHIRHKCSFEAFESEGQEEAYWLCWQVMCCFLSTVTWWMDVLHCLFQNFTLRAGWAWTFLVSSLFQDQYLFCYTACMEALLSMES